MRISVCPLRGRELQHQLNSADSPCRLVLSARTYSHTVVSSSYKHFARVEYELALPPTQSAQLGAASLDNDTLAFAEMTADAESECH